MSVRSSSRRVANVRERPRAPRPGRSPRARNRRCASGRCRARAGARGARHGPSGSSATARVEQADRRGQVAAALVARRPARGQAARPPAIASSGRHRRRPELLPVAERLLEVVADDLVELARPLAGVARASPRTARGVGASLLRDPRYAASRIRTWRNRKPSSPGTVERSGSIRSFRTSDSRVGPTAVLLGESADDCASARTPVRPPLHARAPLSRAIEAVEPGGEQSVDRRRDRWSPVAARPRATWRATARGRAGCPRPPR